MFVFKICTLSQTLLIILYCSFHWFVAFLLVTIALILNFIVLLGVEVLSGRFIFQKISQLVLIQVVGLWLVRRIIENWRPPSVLILFIHKKRAETIYLQAYSYYNSLIYNQPMDLERPRKVSFKVPSSPTIVPRNRNHLKDLVGNTISLKVLEFLMENMRPHHLHFNILEIASILERYVERELSPSVQVQLPIEEDISETMLPLSPQLRRNLSQNPSHSFQLKRDQALQALMEQLKSVFVFWGRNSLSYEYINEYVYNQQLRILNSHEVDEDYMEIGQKRVRIDENLKLCIMPLAYSADDQNSKIREIVFRQNLVGSEIQTVFAVTRNNVRTIHIRPQLIGIAGDYDRHGNNPSSCWYHFQNEAITPKRETITSSVQKPSSKTVLTSEQVKQLKASKLANLDEMMPSHQFLILKAQAGKSIMAIICLDLSFIVEPLGKNSLQGYIGNLKRDVPPVVVYPENREVYQEILTLHCYDDNSWLVLTQRFIYLYRIPTPNENIMLLQQNNSRKDSQYKPNPLLLLCQRLPSGCMKAQVLSSRHVALMLQSNCVVIIQFFILNKGIFEGRQFRPQDNYYKITNKIYNDIQFKTICYNPKQKYLFLSDFGAYLIRLSFSPSHGDIEQEGPVHDKEENQQLTAQMIKNSYIQLKASKSKLMAQSMREVEQQQMENSQPYIEVYYLKTNKEKQHKHLLSLYKKQNKSPHTIIIKNQSRQIITAITVSSHYNTLITYQSETFQKSNLAQFQGDYYREWGNRNTIKLWDSRHMTIYQTLKIPVEASLLTLRANGLYFLTAEKGYLGFYQFNEDKKAIIAPAEQTILDRQNLEVLQQLGDEILLEGGLLYFSSLTTSYNKFNNVRKYRTHLSSFNMQRFPDSCHLQSLPSEITAIAVKSRLYVLQNSRQGVEACQLHIYNRQGLKEEMLIYSYHEDIDVATGKVRHQNYNQEFKFLKKVNHNQFEVAMWNSDCLKLIGLSREESLTVIFNASKIAKASQDIEIYRQVKSIEISGPKILIYYQQNIKIKNLNTQGQSSNRQVANAVATLVVRKRRKSSISARTLQQSNHNIAIFNCQSDRLIFKLQRISQRIKILHIFNSLLLTREEDPYNTNFDIIRVLDIAQPGSLIKKYLFSAKFQKLWTKQVQMGHLKDYALYDPIYEKNQILHNLKQFVLSKHIQIEESKIAVSSSNQLMLVIVFRVETQLRPIIGDQIIRGEVQFLVYTRNITNELVNRDYKVSRLQIGVKTKKNIKEYQTSTARTENINDNKQISFQTLASSSNYGEVDMYSLCMLILEKGSEIPTPDLTPKIVSPALITTSKTKDTCQILNLKTEHSINRIFGQKINKFNILMSSAFKIVEFDEDKLAGVAVVSNKLLKVMAIYSISFDCSRLDGAEDQPYRLSIALQKIGVLQAKTPEPNTLHSSTVNILEWSHQYKSAVDKMWDQTFNSIKTYLKSERVQKQLQKSKSRQKSKSPRKSNEKFKPAVEPAMTQLSLDLKQLPALKIRKMQMLKRKLQHSQRQYVAQFPRQLQKVEEQAENISKMFKKWNINQTIARQKQLLDLNTKNSELKSTNRYINKVLNSQKDKSERIEQLINISQQIKQISRSPRPNSREQSPELVTGRLVQLQNIVKTSEIANTSSLKSYLLHKKQGQTNTEISNPYATLSDNIKLQKQESHLSSQGELNFRYPTQFESPDLRKTNISKLSLYSSATKQAAEHNKQMSQHKLIPVDPTSFEGKLTQKLEELMLERSQSQQKRVATLPCESPSRKKSHSTRNEFLKSRLTQKSTQKNQPGESSHDKPQKFHLYSGISYTVHQSEAQSTQGSPENIKKRSHRYKTEQPQANTSILKLQSAQKKPQNQRRSERKAMQKLKQSQSMLRDLVLPEIMSNKEKLILKMKQKRSYVKIIQDHINDTSLSTLRNGEDRKKLVNMLCEYK